MLYPTQALWVGLFTNSPEVLRAIDSTMPLVLCAIFGYSANTVRAGC